MHHQWGPIPETCPRAIRVIVVHVRRGSGTEEDPYRTVTEYWSADGETVLAVVDDWLDARMQTAYVASLEQR
jgi:hypothetical protein